MLKEGDKAPSFNLETDAGGRVSLRDFADQTLVLYFYPRDSTPGCTRQAQGFTAAQGAIETAGGAVLGVSRDSLKSHATFRQKYALGIPLASDPDLAVHKAYGAWGEKTMYGKKIEGVLRTTFVIQDGLIARVFRNVKVDGHADSVLQSIGELSAGGPSSMRIGSPPAKAGIAKGAGDAIATLARLAGEMVKSVVGAAAKKSLQPRERVAKAAAAKKTAPKKAAPKKVAPKKAAPKKAAPKKAAPKKAAPKKAAPKKAPAKKKKARKGKK